MKKVYEAPAVEKVEFKYRDQVVVASGGAKCHLYWEGNEGASQGCTTDNKFYENEGPVGY